MCKMLIFRGVFDHVFHGSSPHDSVCGYHVCHDIWFRICIVDPFDVAFTCILDVF